MHIYFNVKFGPNICNTMQRVGLAKSREVLENVGNNVNEMEESLCCICGS